jgi:hypothetical protein
VTLACVLASARRLAWAVAPTRLDPALVVEALTRGDHAALMPALAQVLKSDPKADWERDLFSAFDERDSAGRGARVNEQLTELDARAGRWLRVPRVCARLAASAGFLFASIALLRALAASGADATEASPQTLLSAVDAVAIGLAGLSFCVAVHFRSRSVLSRRMADFDRLVGRIEGLTSAQRSS